MKYFVSTLLFLTLVFGVGFLGAAPSNPWRLFKLGLTAETFKIAEATVEDIDFQTEAPSFDTPRLLVFFNLKNVAEKTRRFSVSFALFGENRELLCSAPPRSPELRARASQNLKVDFGECGFHYANAMRIRFFQAAVFSPEIKR